MAGSEDRPDMPWEWEDQDAVDHLLGHQMVFVEEQRRMIGRMIEVRRQQIAFLEEMLKEVSHLAPLIMTAAELRHGLPDKESVPPATGGGRR